MMEAYKYSDENGDWIRLIPQNGYEWDEPAKDWIYEPSPYYLGFHYRNIYTNKRAVALETSL